MPRKVLITKDTLQEILEKYQGGGSSGGGGSGKLYELQFSLTRYDYNGEIVKWSSNIVGVQNADALDFSLFIYESNWERFKQKFATIIAQLNVDLSIDKPQDLVDLFNQSLDQTSEPSDTQAVSLLLLTMQYVDRVIVKNVLYQYEVVTSIGIAPQLGFVGTNSIESQALVGLKTIEGGQEDYFYGLNVNNSCTLTEYGTSASGGTVEAEPIISIKMTNLEVKASNDDQSDIRDAQIYCTKETWNSLVNLANTLGVTLTYQNLGTVLQGLDAQRQGAFIGILLNDYYNGKILPIPYLKSANNYWCVNLLEAVQSNLQSTLGINIDAVAIALWGFDGVNASFPNIIDRTNDGYVTSNTVITVEEIAGPAIGSSSGSGTSDVLYKHSLNVVLYDSDVDTTSNATLTFLSKYSTPFITNGSITDFLQNIASEDDEQVVINPYMRQQTGAMAISTILPEWQNNSVGLVFAAPTVGSMTFPLRYADNTNVTDTVTPYVQVSGGSGSSVELPKYYEVSIYVSSQNSGSNEKMLFNITESNLNILIDEANQQLSSMGYTLTKDNWSTLIPQLGTASSQLRHALIRGLLTLSNNASAEDIDGYSNMICVYADGVIKLGFDQGSYTTIESSSIRLINNHF